MAVLSPPAWFRQSAKSPAASRLVHGRDPACSSSSNRQSQPDHLCSTGTISSDSHHPPRAILPERDLFNLRYHPPENTSGWATWASLKSSSESPANRRQRPPIDGIPSGCPGERGNGENAWVVTHPLDGGGLRHAPGPVGPWSTSVSPCNKSRDRHRRSHWVRGPSTSHPILPPSFAASYQAAVYSEYR